MDRARRPGPCRSALNSALCELGSGMLSDHWSPRHQVLRRHAELGARVGTEHPNQPGFRSFGYKRRATVVTKYAEGGSRILRVCFAGQDWTR